MEAFLFQAHRRGIRTRQGAELRKREAFSSAAREGRRPEARAGDEAARGHPSSPTTELLGLQRWRPFFFSGPAHGIRTRQGAKLRKREAFSSAAREGRRPEAKAGGVSRTRHPSSPTTDLETVLERGPFLLGPISWDSNPPARLSQRPWPENGKNEYCHLAYNISKDSICLSYATYVHYKD